MLEISRKLISVYAKFNLLIGSLTGFLNFKCLLSKLKICILRWFKLKYLKLFFLIKKHYYFNTNKIIYSTFYILDDMD